MRTFSIFILDDRYAIPTVAIITSAEVSGAAEIARARLKDSPHHLSIELFENDVPLAFFDADGEIWRVGHS